MRRQETRTKPDVARGERLVEAREKAGRQQGEVAELLGVVRGTVRRWELGHYVDAGTLAKLAEFYGVTEEHLRGDAAALRPAASAERQRPSSREFPQWAREMWAEQYLELVKAGIDEDAITRLRSFVLAPELLGSSMADAELRLDVEAGLAAVRAWVHVRRGVSP